MNSINLIQDKMNLTSANLSLISDNIANINTPDYQRKYIDVQGTVFSSSLSTKLKQTNDKHLSLSKDSLAKVNTVDAYMRTDGNGVDVDTEVIELNKNKLFYNSLISLMNRTLENQKNIINSKP